MKLGNFTCTELCIWVAWMGLLYGLGTGKYFNLVHLSGGICNG